jgi:hypothetical protein
MKTTFIQKTIILALFLTWIGGCSDDDKVRDTNVTAVKTLYEPAADKSIVLQTSASATAYFEWEPAKAEDSGMVLYELAFDRANGDFSSPVYRMPSDNNGGYNHATVTHKQLNKIAAMMGIESAATGKFQWTVFSSKGINEKRAEEVRTIEITRLAGFADVPVDVYVTGEGSEGGTDLSKAQPMKAIAGGEFEVYTKLTVGKTYYFTDAKTGTPRRFYTENGLLKEGETAITPSKTAVYRINLDFNVGNATYTEVKAFKLFFCPNNIDLFELPYSGYGVFKAASQPVNFKQESWGGDERYKFRMYITDAQGERIEYWGTKNNTDSRPTATSPASYYYIMNTPTNQWDQKWKFAGEMDGALVDATAFFQAEGEYTHEIKKVGNQ